MKAFRISAIAAAFLLSTLPSASSVDNIEACKVPDTKWSQVSLGFPVKKERLNYIAKPRVLVIPFHPSDAPSFSLSSEEKANFLQSAKDIYELSSGSSQIEFVFNPTVKLAITTLDMDYFKIRAQETYLKDFENDQFGFAFKFIQDNDPAIDYTGIDSVILYGFSFYRQQEIASALQYTSDMNFVGNSSKRKDGKPWFAPIVTDEKLISNVVLMYNRTEPFVITHELLHNYGLTDLYGAPNTPGFLSRMAEARAETLLTYEKWVLGWHSDKDVTCVSGSNSEMINKFVFDVRNKEQIALVRPNQSPYMYILETAIVKNNFLLSFYKLTNDARPPIEYYSYGSPKSTAGVNLADLNTIATIYKGDQFSVFIHSIKDSLATVYVYPNSASTSSEVLKLQAEAQAEAKIAIELKAKQEAEAKAAAELKAKQEAEAKAAAELKAKQEAEAAALAAAAKSKKTTITCAKGKLTKKVTAVKPKCPAGYKRK
jgi:hypothetical protein